MSWNGSGIFSRKVTTVSPAVGGTTIDVADQNSYTADVTAGIDACLAKNGENAATGELNLGSNKITNLADGVADDDAATVEQAKHSIHCDNSDGTPTISGTVVDIPGVSIVDAWETYGPTGSGADNIWTALDSVPAGVDWIEVKVQAVITIASGTTLGIELRARENGSVSVDPESTQVFYIYSKDGDSDAKGLRSTVTGIKIPVDGDVICDLLYSEDGTLTSDGLTMLLTGYGWN